MLSFNFKDMTGKRFGRWTVVSLSNIRTCSGGIRWNCLCDCGTVRDISSSSLLAGTSLSCGCILKEWIRKTKRLRPYESLYNWLLKQAARTERNCTLTYIQFLQFTKIKQCHYCGDKVSWAEFNINENGSAYNLDRKDSSKGYSKENCIVCCIMCNTMKRDFSYHAFVSKIRQIYKRSPWRS